MTTIKIRQGDSITIDLPGMTAIRIDTEGRFIAIDGISGDNYTSPEPLFPDYLVHDLRNGTYGGFHRLLPADECFDPAGCADATDPAGRQHVYGAYPHNHEGAPDALTCETFSERGRQLATLPHPF